MHKLIAAVSPGDAYYEEVLRTTFRLARGRPFQVLSVYPKPIEWVSDPNRTAESRTQGERDAVAQAIEKDVARLGLGNPVVTVSLGQRAAIGDDIVEQARVLGATMVVLGTHGRTGLDAWVTGSVAERVVRRAHCGVYVVRNRAESPPVKSSQ